MDFRDLTYRIVEGVCGSGQFASTIVIRKVSKNPVESVERDDGEERR